MCVDVCFSNNTVLFIIQRRKSRERNTTFKLKDVKQHIHDVMLEIYALDWSKTCDQMGISRSRKNEHPPVIINLESDNSDDSDSDDPVEE